MNAPLSPARALMARAAAALLVIGLVVPVIEFRASGAAHQSEGAPSQREERGPPTTPPPGRASETPARDRAADPSRVARARNPIEASDQKFITNIALVNSEELRLSEVAAQRASNPAIKSLAQEILSQHENHAMELAQLAERNGVTLPTGRSANAILEDAQQTKADAGFDRQYLTDLVTTQKTQVSLLEDYAKRADDRELAAFARKQLPLAQETLRKAEALKEQLD